MAVKKPTFGGKPKTGSKPPNALANKMLGGTPHRKRAQDVQQSMDKSLGNVERGFIQNTPKKATAAMMGRAPPKTSGKNAANPKSRGGKKSFGMPKGAKPF